MTSPIDVIYPYLAANNILKTSAGLIDLYLCYRGVRLISGLIRGALGPPTSHTNERMSEHYTSTGRLSVCRISSVAVCMRPLFFPAFLTLLEPGEAKWDNGVCANWKLLLVLTGIVYKGRQRGPESENSQSNPRKLGIRVVYRCISQS